MHVHVYVHVCVCVRAHALPKRACRGPAALLHAFRVRACPSALRVRPPTPRRPARAIDRSVSRVPPLSDVNMMSVFSQTPATPASAALMLPTRKSAAGEARLSPAQSATVGRWMGA
jgi:hypothetical protein